MSSDKTKRLGVNIDHIATIRKLRDTPYPNLVHGAQEAIVGGADQITVHLREDRRHILDADLWDLKKAISADINLEMAVTEEMLEIALKLKPFSICLVPEKREERTTEGGLDLANAQKTALLKKITEEAKAAGILVSYFIELNEKDLLLSKSLGAQAVELHTGSLCLASQASLKTVESQQKFEQEFARVKNAAKKAQELGLRVHAGHGIDYEIAPLLGVIPEITEYNIGHSIIAESVFCGLREAVRKMKSSLKF